MKPISLNRIVFTFAIMHLISHCAFGGFVLTGAVLYSATETGAQNIYGYKYTTNSSDGSYYRLFVGNENGGANNAISIDLVDGINSFTFGWQNGPSSPGPYVGLGLFFSNISGTSFNPSEPSEFAGDLTVFVPVGQANFSTVAQGINTTGYGTGPGTAVANGNSRFVLGNSMVEVVAFTSTSEPTGSFSLQVSAVPEPSSMAVFVLIGLVGSFVRHRRNE